jgi:hypothetical protein
MEHYYVNDAPQPTGEHEVHTTSCEHFDIMKNRIYLGYFSNCHDAIAMARRVYLTVDGCFHCCQPCHTR